jgi:MFS family permease
MSVFAVASLSSALFEVPTGVFSDRIGRRRTFVLGSVADVTAVTLYAASGNYALLVCGAICQGLAMAFFSGNNNALLYDTLAASGQQDRYQHYLGRITSREHVAWALSGVGGGLVAAVSLRLTVWVSILPALAGLGIGLALQDPPGHTSPAATPYAHLRTALRLILTNPRLRLISLASILEGSVGEASYQLRAAFVQTLWPLWAVGAARTLDNLLAAASYFFSGQAIQRFGEFRLLVWGGIASRVVNVVAVAIPTPISPVLLSSTSLLHGVNTVAQEGLRQRDFTTEQRATLGSLVSLGGSLLFALFSLVLGTLADQIGIAGALLVAQGIGCLPLALYWRVFRRTP